MATNRKQFGRPGFVDHELLDMAGFKIGTIRVKPSGISWKPKSAREFYSVSLDKFTEWITSDDCAANRNKQ